MENKKKMKKWKNSIFEKLENWENLYTGEVSRQVQHVVDSALPLLLKAFDTDDDKEAVTAAVLGCEAILTGAGPQCCQSYMEPLATGASMVRRPPPPLPPPPPCRGSKA